MTQEQKAEAYSKAVEKAKLEYNTTTSEDRKQWLEELFPELKESKDELTWLTRYIEEEAYSLSMDIRDNEDRIKLEKLKKSLAWLEKQPHVDMDKFAKGVLFGVSNSIIQWLDANVAEGNMCLSDMECEAIEDAVVDSNWSKVYAYMKKKLEKQGEKPQGKTALEAIKEEKVDNANKVEPKFHEGDWVIDKQGIVHQVANVVENVTNHTYGYDIVGGGYFNDNNEGVRLWTISDAKDGDVLFHSDSASNGIFIFKELLKYEFSEKVICYCDYDSEDHFCLGENHTCCWTDAKILHPATKEQRELLFQKMKEAGYAFDFEKKELKKIEQIHADEVEPKFHEGDWVVYNNDICQIVKREEGCNKLVTVFGIEKELVNERNLSTARLWTIADAKDGDVLVASDGSIFLFAGVVDCACKYYAALATDDYVKINKEAKGGYWETSRAVYPATKEQRDKLEKEMSDAGYAFDFDKKELKKIEKKSEEKSIIISLKDFQKAFELKAKQYDIELPNRGYDIHAMCKELYSLLIEQNSTWSEEDGNKVKELIGYLNELFDKYRLDLQELNDYEAWFKSIKKRLGGFK